MSNSLLLLVLPLLLMLLAANVSSSVHVKQTDSKYFTVDGLTSTWTAALIECARLDGQLPQLDNVDNVRQFEEHIRKANLKDAWIGATSQSMRGDWVWVSTGTALRSTATNWDRHYPDNDQCAVAVKDRSSKWQSHACSRQHHIVCERRTPVPEPIPCPTTTTTTTTTPKPTTTTTTPMPTTTTTTTTTPMPTTTTTTPMPTTTTTTEAPSTTTTPSPSPPKCSTTKITIEIE